MNRIGTQGTSLPQTPDRMMSQDFVTKIKAGAPVRSALADALSKAAFKGKPTPGIGHKPVIKVGY